MANALIGYSGFVGSTLLHQHRFADLYRSTNIREIEGRSFDIVVCAAAPGQKWIANRDPTGDREKIASLMDALKSITCKSFVLISTIDVFVDPIGVDEATVVEERGLHAYGLHRRELEKFVEDHFSDRLIVRLPGLVGPGLRKNVVFDFLNDNNLGSIDGRAVYQFYPMVKLWPDIQAALKAKLNLVHLTAEPIAVSDVAEQGFGRVFSNVLAGDPASYDMRTRHAGSFGAQGDYQYSRHDSLAAIRAYAQSEPRMMDAAKRSAT